MTKNDYRNRWLDALNLITDMEEMINKFRYPDRPTAGEMKEKNNIMINQTREATCQKQRTTQ